MSFQFDAWLILPDLLDERERQDNKFGDQSHLPDGTGLPNDRAQCNYSRTVCQLEFSEGRGTWRAILTEEFTEALAESDPVALRAELVQVATVAIAWCEAIDKRDF